ncbi:hypothetical protein NE237_002292 [Protea cynaroides]|uniref:RNase H type-1 domain-containing protein n=1 Tax=Protea cynaroides TaxID=273540 RepID=A0A9Q0KUZ1_9MAGN|nr:hypothetical protein NE237_002292 [Protea cynaroides]
MHFSAANFIQVPLLALLEYSRILHAAPPATATDRHGDAANGGGTEEGLSSASIEVVGTEGGRLQMGYRMGHQRRKKVGKRKKSKGEEEGKTGPSLLTLVDSPAMVLSNEAPRNFASSSVVGARSMTSPGPGQVTEKPLSPSRDVTALTALLVLPICILLSGFRRLLIGFHHPLGSLSFNIDAALSLHSSSSGIGYILRSSTGKPGIQVSWSMPYSSVAVGEALTIRVGVMAALAAGFDTLHLESDCAEVVNLNDGCSCSRL